MTNTISTKMIRYARTAGILYLIIIVTGLFSEMFVRGSLITQNDPLATINNIKANETLYRLGFISDLTMAICDVGVAYLFYILLKSVDKQLAALAMIFRLIQATIIAMNLIHYFAVIVLIKTGSTNIAQSVMYNLSLHKYGYLISGVFFGISCIVLGYLFKKSTNFPQWLGYLILLGGAGYLIDCFANFILPEYAPLTEILLLFTAVIAELSLCLLLLIKGVKRPPLSSLTNTNGLKKSNS